MFGLGFTRGEECKCGICFDVAEQSLQVRLRILYSVFSYIFLFYPCFFVFCVLPITKRVLCSFYMDSLYPLSCFILPIFIVNENKVLVGK